MYRYLSISLLLLSGSCSSGLSVITEQVEIIQPSDFVNTVQEIEVIDEVGVSQENEELIVDTEETEIGEGLIASDIGYLEEESILGEAGEWLTVDSLIGHVNGRPIYANEVLDLHADKYRAIAIPLPGENKMHKLQYEQVIEQQLYRKNESMGMTIREGDLYDIVEHYLLLSEAMSAIPERVEMGLVAMVDQMRRGLASTYGGSEARSQQAFEDLDSSVDDFLRVSRERFLIETLYNRKVRSKVNVKWRDIVREFDSIEYVESVDQTNQNDSRTNYIVDQLQRKTALRDVIVEDLYGEEEFSLAFPHIILGRIKLSVDSPKVQIVKELFDKGLTFSEVATQIGEEDGGFWTVCECSSAGLDDIDRIKDIPDAFRSALMGASMGEYIEPFEFKSTIYWLSVIDVVPPISLYNKRIQMAVHDFLWSKYYDRERIRFVDSLWGEGSIEELDKMAKELASIAAERYYNSSD